MKRRHPQPDHHLEEAKRWLQQVLAGQERYRLGITAAIDHIEAHQREQEQHDHPRP